MNTSKRILFDVELIWPRRQWSNYRRSLVDCSQSNQFGSESYLIVWFVNLEISLLKLNLNRVLIMLCSMVFYLLLQEERKFWTEVYRVAVIWKKEKDMCIIYIIDLEFSNFSTFVLISLRTIFYVQICLRAKGCVNERARAKTQGWWNCNCLFAGVLKFLFSFSILLLTFIPILSSSS